MKLHFHIDLKKVEALLPIAEELFGSRLNENEKMVLALLLHQKLSGDMVDHIISEANKNDSRTKTP